MTKRDPHPDNDLIDSMAEDSGGSTAQNDRSGGNLARDVGTRAEQRAVQDPWWATRWTGPRARTTPEWTSSRARTRWAPCPLRPSARPDR